MTKDEKTKSKRGGAREGAGRKPKYPSGAMKQYTVRMPEQWKEDLIAEFGNFQAGVETLVKAHRENTGRPL